MKTILITGATDGIGRSLALHYLSRSEHVVAIGNSREKGDLLYKDTASLPGKLTFIQADLSSIQANRKLVADVHNKFTHIDTLIFCANVFRERRQETAEGLEMMLALSYLSRYVLSFGLADLLEKSTQPVIINVTGAGMNGRIRWDDLQSQKQYRPFAVTLQNSHLNDMLGAAFAARYPQLRYILFNPVFVRTPGLLNSYSNPIVRSMVRLAATLFARSPQATAQVIATLAASTDRPLSLYKQKKAAAEPAYSTEDLAQLEAETQKLLGRK